jgi:hypothetical protein
MKDLYGKCGCNCGRCLAFVANARTPRDRIKCSNGWKEYLNASLNPKHCICNGCQTEDPWKTGYLIPDRGCNIRPCAIALGVRTCAECSEYPCEDLKARIPGRGFRDGVAKRLGRPVPQDDYLTFLEPYEGLKHLDALRLSLKSRSIVKMPKIPPLKSKTVKFPDQTILPGKEVSGLKALHNLLYKINVAHAATYARQIIVKRRKDLLLSILWVFGLYGRSVKSNGATLVISSEEDAAGYVNIIVRKRDSAVHTYAAQSFRILKGYGVRVEHISKKKEWKLVMRFNKKAGGPVALAALQRFVRTLVKRYGRPKYAGSSRYRGKAFELFSRVDMSIFTRNHREQT